MLRKFNIKIDGKEYLVEMEEIGGVPQAPAAPVAPAPVAAAPAPVQETPAVAPEAPAPTATKPGADAMKSPMPGTILKILVDVGETVKENQPLMILEAMKMENEVVAGQAGTVQAIHVAAGTVVNAGDALITLR